MVARVYKNSAGNRLPSVTTIIGKFKQSDGLIHWAWKLGIEGRDYKKEKQKAADSGTIAHNMVEAHLRGETWVDDGEFGKEIVDKGRRAFENYLRWADTTKVDVLYAEVPLISEAHQFGGCLDAIGFCKAMHEGHAIFDWKSSNALYADYLFQLGAYRILWNENYPDVPLIGGTHLLRFSKDDGVFTHKYFDDLKAEEESFLLMRQLYEKVKVAEKRIK